MFLFWETAKAIRHFHHWRSGNRMELLRLSAVRPDRKWKKPIICSGELCARRNRRLLYSKRTVCFNRRMLQRGSVRRLHRQLIIIFRCFCFTACGRTGLWVRKNSRFTIRGLLSVILWSLMTAAATWKKRSAESTCPGLSALTWTKCLQCAEKKEFR